MVRRRYTRWRATVVFQKSQQKINESAGAAKIGVGAQFRMGLDSRREVECLEL